MWIGFRSEFYLIHSILFSSYKIVLNNDFQYERIRMNNSVFEMQGSHCGVDLLK